MLAPALVKLKEQGKVRHVGITETGPNDPEQKMLARAIEEAAVGSHHAGLQPDEPGRARKIFPTTQRRGIGTLLMFVVRNIFSNAAYRRDIAAKLVEQGQLDRSILSEGDPLGFPRCPTAPRRASPMPRTAMPATSGASMSSCSAPATRIT